MIHARPDYQRIQDPEGKIGEDEPVMLFRAQDKYFRNILWGYYGLLKQDPEAQPEMFQAIMEHIKRVDAWQSTHPTKTPDLPPAAPAEGREG